jgi:hypothetical protein
MNNIKIEPWNRLPDLVDRSVDLTDHEWAVLAGSVKQVAHNIFRREKNPMRIRILLSCIKNVIEIEAVAYAAAREATFKRRLLKDRAQKSKRKEKKPC